MIAVIIKKWPPHVNGDVVDTEGWRNTERMIKSRHIRPATASEVAEFERKKAADVKSKPKADTKPKGKGDDDGDD